MLLPVVLQPEEFGKVAPLIWDAYARGELAIDAGNWLTQLRQQMPAPVKRALGTDLVE